MSMFTCSKCGQMMTVLSDTTPMYDWDGDRVDVKFPCWCPNCGHIARVSQRFTWDGKYDFEEYGE